MNEFLKWSRIRRMFRKCDLCGRVLLDYEVLHINIAQNIKIHYFCNKTCKTAWLLKQLKNLESEN